MNAPSKTEVEAPYVLREDRDGVATLTLNRGDRMNPLSTAMLSALQAEIDRVAKDADTKVVVLAGAGKHFCAGHDLREMRSHPGKPWQKALFEQCSQMMLSLVRLPQPVIARVQGVAVAASSCRCAIWRWRARSPSSHFRGSRAGFSAPRRASESRATSRASTRLRCSSQAT